VTKFSLSKKRPGFYVNDGDITFSVQAPEVLNGQEGRLIEAIRAARAEFCRVYFAGENAVYCPPQLAPERKKASK
jgi:hypothetical protein